MADQNVTNGSNGAGDHQAIADTQVQTSPAQPQPQTPYGPASYHPLMIKQDDQAGRGSYYDYVSMVKWMVDRHVNTLGQYVQSGWYRPDWRRKRLVLSLIHI